VTRTVKTRLIAYQLPNLNSRKNKACFEAKSVPGKKSLAFLFEDINDFKRQLKPEKNASSKKRTRKIESILSTEINESIYSLIVIKVRSACLPLLSPLSLAKQS
jgi:hypothetical protein